MRVAVLGAGNGGVASAFDFAQQGHEVSLYATPDLHLEHVDAQSELVEGVELGGGSTRSSSRTSSTSALGLEDPLARILPNRAAPREPCRVPSLTAGQ
jgi:hypothetical protein